MQKEKNSLELITTQYFNLEKEIKLDCGKKIGPLTLAYETYGQLNNLKNNAILVLHALSGDAHAAGWHKGDARPGWWDDFIGPKKALDTEKYFVICANVLGGCKGSTGPSSINPKTNKPYALDFPLITIGDMVRAQKQLIDHLGIKKLLSVIGGSMGGMQVLQWVSSYPQLIASAIPIATALKHSPQQIAFNEVARQAIMADPDWRQGNYYGVGQPEKGLAVARMLGHITYMSDQSMEKKFSRKLKEEKYGFNFNACDFEVEGYLRYRGDSFVKRFDANSYLYITKAMDYFDLTKDKFINATHPLDARFLVVAFKSDWLYPAYQSQEIARQLKMHGLEASYCRVDSSYGHDAFLVEVKELTRLLENFLHKTFTAKNYGS